MRRFRGRCGLIGAFWLLASASALPADVGRAQVVVNAGRYGPYYHLRFDLSASSVDFSSSDREAGSGGQFELRLRPETFPIPAPNCRGLLILRMPWTAPDAPEAEAKIAEKRDLLERVRALGGKPGVTLPAVIELNPYVEVVERAPVRLRLTHCNIFFRHAHGGYVDHTGPLAR